MPTELPPGYKPKPANDPGSPVNPAVPGSRPAYSPEQGEDARNPTEIPEPGDDALDPPELPGAVPTPAGVPSI